MTQFSNLEAIQIAKTKLLKWAAIQIYYYLIAADGEINEQEMESFLEIAKETDPLFDQYKAQLIEECENQVKKASEEEKRCAVLKEGIDLVYRDQLREIFHGLEGKSGQINANMFIWNMLSIVMCDGTYADEESELIHYVVRKFDLDQEVFLELDNAMKAILDIDQSIAWMTQKENPFVIKGTIWEISSSEIGRFIDEFTGRREVILSSVKEMTKE